LVDWLANVKVVKMVGDLVGWKDSLTVSLREGQLESWMVASTVALTAILLVELTVDVMGYLMAAATVTWLVDSTADQSVADSAHAMVEMLVSLKRPSWS
jgi:hypothetical protein